MMRDLDDAKRRPREERRNVRFRLAADVTREDKRHVAPPQFQHDGVVVAYILSLPVGHGRMPDGHLYAVEHGGVPPLDGGPPCPGRYRIVAKAAKAFRGGTGMPSQMSHGRNSRTTDGAPPT